MTNDFEALPIEVKNSALTANQKSLLEIFVLLDGLEQTKANGYFYASNADLLLKSGIGSHHTLTKVIRSFEMCNFITRSVGSFEGRQATTYTLNMEAVLNWCEAHPIGAVSKRHKSAPIKSAPTMEAALQKCPDEHSAKVVAMEKKINELEAVIKALSKCGIEAVEKAIIGAGIGAVLEEITEKCPTDTDIEKETTNPIVTNGKTIENNDYSTGATFKKVEGSKPDEVNPSNADESDICDFQKIEGNNPSKVDNPNDEETNQSQATANKADQSVSTPQTIQTPNDEGKTRQIANKGANPVSGDNHLNPEERINQLHALQLWKMNTPNVNPIELSKELGKILANGVVYQSHAYKKAEEVATYLPMYANDIDTLNEIETFLTSAHIEKYGSSTPSLNDAFDFQRNYLANPQTLENSPGPHQSVADLKDEETITNDEKRAQNAPDKATGAIEVDKTTDRLLTEFVNNNAQWNTGDYEREQKALTLMNKVADRCGKIGKIEGLNWCAINIPDILNEHGRVLGTNAEMYLNAITNIIANRRKELLAA